MMDCTRSGVVDDNDDDDDNEGIFTTSLDLMCFCFVLRFREILPNDSAATIPVMYTCQCNSYTTTCNISPPSLARRSSLSVRVIKFYISEK